MKHLITLLMGFALLAGCRAPTPSFDPWAAYGPRRIPPPATGSVGQPVTPQPYYQPPPEAGAGIQPIAPGSQFSTPLPNTRPLNAAPLRVNSANLIPVPGKSVMLTTANSNLASAESSPRRDVGWKPTATEAETRTTAVNEVASDRAVRFGAPSVPEPRVAVRTADRTSLPAEPARFDSPGVLRDITELPEPTRTARQPEAIRAPVRTESRQTTVPNSGWRAAEFQDASLPDENQTAWIITPR